MAWMIGVDEAGYGPNLGPLVVAATAWHHEEATVTQKKAHAADIDLYDLLRDVVCLKRSDELIAIADSKQLYQPGKGLRQLERGVHVACAAVRRGNHAHCPGILPGLSCWSELLDFLQADPDNRRATLPWHDGFDCPLPIDATAEELDEAGELFYTHCQSTGARPIAIRARLVFPSEFNHSVTHHSGKCNALSYTTLSLVRSLCDEIRALRAVSDEPVLVVCDKHGGRNKYRTFLKCHFPELRVRRIVEGTEESRYRCTVSKMFIGSDGSPPDMDIAFRTNGETFLPTALASMTAKYLRELAMRAENHFWSLRVANLRPTAGYPIDARRFKAEIATTQTALGIEDHILWRTR
jgi:ribonuclease HII